MLAQQIETKGKEVYTPLGDDEELCRHTLQDRACTLIQMAKHLIRVSQIPEIELQYEAALRISHGPQSGLDRAHNARSQ